MKIIAELDFIGTVKEESKELYSELNSMLDEFAIIFSRNFFRQIHFGEFVKVVEKNLNRGL